MYYAVGARPWSRAGAGAATTRRTRTEVDFINHIAQTVATDETGEWIFITDQLNTYQAAGLVEWIAGNIGDTQDLGEKAQRGILQTMATRAAYLREPTHRIRFVYTPIHCSWRNQIELCLNLLVRRLLKRGSFTSKEELRTRILAFIEYFNATLAKPFKWTYKGRPLQV